MKRFLASAFLIFGFSFSASALQIEGVRIAPSASLSGQALPLNGAGLRTVVLLVVPVKAYVAAFYAPTPLRTSDAVLASPGPMQFDFTFLQGVPKSQVAQAWRAQFDASATFSYPGSDQDEDTFIQMFGALKKGGVQTVVLDGLVTKVFENGVLKGTIAGRNFQKAFLSMWFGSQPVMPSLKSALLGN